MCRKAEGHLKLNPARKVKCIKKDFYRYISSKMKMRKNVTRKLVTKDTTVSALMSTSKTSLEESHLPEASGKVWSKEHLPAVEKNQVREHLKKLDVHKFMGLGSMHL